ERGTNDESSDIYHRYRKIQGKGGERSRYSAQENAGPGGIRGKGSRRAAPGEGGPCLCDKTAGGLPVSGPDPHDRIRGISGERLCTGCGDRDGGPSPARDPGSAESL